MKYGLDVHVPFSHQKEVCYWCNGSLARLRNIYKGMNCERFYCSAEHLKNGEEAYLRKKAAAAGTVSSHYLVSASILVMLMLAFIFSGGHKAWAHNPDTHQPDALSDAYSDAYGKCCDGFDYYKLRIEQWEPTDKGWRILWHGQWLDVPRNAKVKNMSNPDGDAKAWVYGSPGEEYVRCFMPGALT